MHDEWGDTWAVYSTKEGRFEGGKARGGPLHPQMGCLMEEGPHGGLGQFDFGGAANTLGAGEILPSNLIFSIWGTLLEIVCFLKTQKTPYVSKRVCAGVLACLA